MAREDAGGDQGKLQGGRGWTLKPRDYFQIKEEIFRSQASSMKWKLVKLEEGSSFPVPARCRHKTQPSGLDTALVHAEGKPRVPSHLPSRPGGLSQAPLQAWEKLFLGLNSALTLPWWRCPQRVTFLMSSELSIRSARKLKGAREKGIWSVSMECGAKEFGQNSRALRCRFKLLHLDSSDSGNGMEFSRRWHSLKYQWFQEQNEMSKVSKQEAQGQGQRAWQALHVEGPRSTSRQRQTHTKQSKAK